MEKRKLKKTLLSSVVGVLVGLVNTPIAIAQVIGDGRFDENHVGDEIIVTGTNIRGTEVVGSSVLIIGQDELIQSGRATAADFLRELPSNLAGGVAISDSLQSSQDTGSQLANLSAGQGVNLRGLGALSTLVLVNGRRQAASGQFGDFIDISTIPTAAIDRMEILQDGASAIYGSDAVGGVVNFILKRHVDAPVTNFRVGTTTEGGGSEVTVSHVQGFEWNGGTAMLGGEFRTRDHVKATQRDKYSLGSDFTRFGGINWPIYTLHAGPVTNIFLGDGGLTSPVGAIVPLGSNDNLTNADLILQTDGLGSTHNVYMGTDILPKTTLYSLFGAFDQNMSGNLSLFGDAMFSRRITEYDTGFSLLGSSLPNTSPFFINDIDPSLTNRFGEIGFSRLLEDRLSSRKASVDHVSGELGARIGLFGDWEGELVASYAQDDQSRISNRLRSGEYLEASMVGCALGFTVNPLCATVNAIPLNPFSTEPLSAAQLDQYYGYENLYFKSKALQLSAKADGTLMTLPAGEVKIAIGADYRSEKISADAEYNIINPIDETFEYETTKRDAVSLFGEAIIPIFSDVLEVSAAGRYEKFSGDGAYDTFDPKLGFNFTPMESLKIFGSWGTSFHAPAMRYESDSPEPLSGGNAAFILNVSRFAPCDTNLFMLNGIAGGTVGNAGEFCSFTSIVNTGSPGAGVLKPETADTFTVGFDAQPETFPGLRIGASYFNITVKDKIQRIQSGTLNQILANYFASGGTDTFGGALIINPDESFVQSIMDNPKYEGTFGPSIADSAADVVMVINATQLNIAALKEEGFDFNVSYDFETDSTDWGVFAHGTYLTNYSFQSGPGRDFEDILGKYSPVGSPVKLRAKAGIRAKHGAFDGRITYNYTDDYECDACYIADANGRPVISPTPVKIESWNTFDLDLGWDISGFGGLADGTRLNLQVVNLFDEDAPFLDGGTGANDPVPTAYDPANATIIGRSVALQITKTW